MSDETKNSNNPGSTERSGFDEWSRISRRGLIKALGSVPVFGVFFYNFFKKKAAADFKKEEVLAELGVSESGPAVIPDAISRPPGDRLRVGIIGYGGEGESLIRNA